MPTAQEIFNIKPSAPTAEDLTVYTPYSQISDRYPNQYLGINNENLYGETQTSGDKWKNAAVKFGATAISTFVEGTAGLVNGVYQGLKDGQFTSFYDNDFNKSLDQYTSQLENTNPTYYTDKEKNAAWYSPDTWATANFLSDTLFKNAGFAVGALGSGLAWGKAFSLVGKAASLIGEGGTTAAEALEAANAADAALLTRSGSELASNLDGIAKSLSTSEKAVQWLKNVTPEAKNLVRSVTAASGEAQIEAYHAKDTYLQDMKQKYFDQYGTQAEGQTLKQMEDTAANIGNLTFGANMVLLTGTNLIQFPKIMGKAWSAEKNALANEARLVVKDAEGNIIRTGKNVVANLAEGETYAASRGTNIVADQLEKTGLGRKLNRVSRFGRLIFSPSEAFEEGAQSIIPVSAQDYFDKGSDTKGDLWASFKKGVETELNDKDFYISVLSGGLTGALMERGGASRERKQQIANSDVAAQAFNDTSFTVDNLKNSTLGSHMQELSRSLNRAEVLSKEAGDALVNEDRLTYEDKKTDLWLNYLLPRIQYGRVDLVQGEIDGWKKAASTEQGWNQLVKSGQVSEDQDREQFLANMDKLSDLTKTTQTHFTNLNQRYANIKNEDGTPKFSQNNLLKLAYIGSKIDDYNKRIQDLTGEVGQHSILTLPLLDALSIKVSDDFDENKAQSDKVQEFAEDIKRQLDARSDMSIEQKEDIFTQLSDLAELTYRRNLKVSEYETYRDNPQAFDDTNKQDQEANEQNTEPVEEAKEEKTSNKRAFFENNKGQQFELNFGRRGNQTGELVYDEKNNILAVKTEQGLHEVTSQDFKDGLVSRVDPTVQDDTYQPFLQEADNRIEVKRRNTINQISKLQREKQAQITASEERIKKLRNQIVDLRNKAELETNGEVLTSLNDLRLEVQDSLQKIEEENNDLLDQMAVYQDILDNRTFDYAMVLNDVESLMDKTSSVIEGLKKEKSLIDKLLNTINETVKYWTGILRDKIFIRQRSNPNDINLSMVGKMVDRFLEDDGDLKYNILTDQIQNINNLELQPSKAQRDKLNTQLEDIEFQIASVERGLENQKQVYAEMLDQVLSVENPIDPQDFISQEEAETIVEEAEEEEPETEISSLQKLFQGAKKKLSNFFTSTKSVPDNFKEAWYTRYNKATKAITKMSRSERSKLRTMFVTANNEQALGLEGLINSMFLKEGKVPYFKSREEALNPIKGGIAAIIISQEEDGTKSFIGEDGRVIGKVGDKIDLNKVIGSKMSVASRNWDNGQEGFINDTNQDPEQLKDAYQQERERILKDTSDTPATYRFTLSRGVQKNKGENRIVGNLLNREDAGKEGILQIVLKDGTFTTPDGQEHKATTKFVMLKTEDTQTPVLPRKFDNKDAMAMALAVKEYAIHTILNKGNSESLAHFIKTQLPYNTKFNGTSLQLNAGTIIDFEIFRNGTEEEQAKALDTIQSYLLTRNIKIANDLQQPFTEYHTDQDDNLVKRDWNTYQEFLLANDHGTEPRGTQPILLTSISETDNKYLQLQGFMNTSESTPTGIETTEEAEVIPEQVQLSKVNPYDLSILEGFRREEIVALGNTAALVDEDTRKEFLRNQATAKALGVKFQNVLKDIAKAFPNKILDLRGIDLNRGSASIIDELNNITPEDRAKAHSENVRQQFVDILTRQLKGKKNKQELVNAGMNLLENVANNFPQGRDAFYGQYSVVSEEEVKPYKPNLISNLDAIIKNNGGKVTVDTGSFEVDIFEGKAEITDIKGKIPEEVYEELNNKLSEKGLKEDSPIANLPLNQDLSIEEVNNIGLINQSLFQQGLYDKISEVAKTLGIQVRFTNETITGAEQAGAFYDPLTGKVIMQMNNLRQSYENQLAGKGRGGNTLLGVKEIGTFEDFVTYVLTHELIHSVTQNAYNDVYANSRKGKYTGKLNEAQVNAILSINKILNHLKTLDKDQYFGGKEYGLENVAELMAEMSNEGFVSALQRISLPENLRHSSQSKNIFEDIIQFIRELFTGSKVENNAADSLYSAISDIITSPQIYEFTQSEVTVDENTPFQIVGEQATNNDALLQANLNLAKQMLSEGESKRDIKYATGFEFDEKEQKWKAETEDTFTISKMEDGTLEEVLDNADELFKLYPALKDMDLFFIDTEDQDFQGAYSPKGLLLNLFHIRQMDGNYENNVHQTLLHELQHAVQTIEGFENGGTSTAMKTEDANLRSLANKVYLEGWAKLALKDKRSLKQAWAEKGISRFVQFDPFRIERDNIDTLEDAVEQLEIFENLFPDKGAVELMNALDEKLGKTEYDTAFNKYQSLAGEVEARNAANRSDMSLEERKETLLADTEDVAMEDKIYTGKPSSMSNSQVYRGSGNNVGQQNNNEVLWVAEDEDVAKNYSENNKAEKIDVVLPQNPFEMPFNVIYTKGSDVGLRLRAIRDNLFKAKKLSRESFEKVTEAINNYETAAGEKSELYSTKTNKPEAVKPFVTVLKMLGFDGLSQLESATSASPFTKTRGGETMTYGIFKDSADTSLVDNESPVSKIANLIIDKGQQLQTALKNQDIKKLSELFNIPVNTSSFESFLQDPQPELSQENLDNANLAVQISAAFTLPEQDNIYEQPAKNFLERVSTLENNIQESSNKDVPSLQEYLNSPDEYEYLNLLNKIQPEGLPSIEAIC